MAAPTLATLSCCCSAASSGEASRLATCFCPAATAFIARAAQPAQLQKPLLEIKDIS